MFTNAIGTTKKFYQTSVTGILTGDIHHRTTIGALHKVSPELADLC